MLSLLGLPLIALGLLGLADLGPFRASRPQAGPGVMGGVRPARVILTGVGLVVIDVVLALVLAVGMGVVSAQDAAESVQTVTVEVDPRSAEQGGTPVFVDGLEPSAVLYIEASRFPTDTTGSMVQCIYFEQRRCHNRQSIRFDDGGRADVQYLVEDTISASGDEARCGPGGPRCTVEVVGGRAEAVIDLLFGAIAPPPGTLEVSPRSGLTVGDEIVVGVRGFPPGVALVVTVCAEPAVGGDRCGAPGPEVAMITDDTGRAEATMVLDVARVGVDGVACGRRTRCQAVVLSDDVAVRARPVGLGLADTPGPQYDPTRLLVGLVVAVGLLALAAVLIRTTGWGPPSEADGTLIDDAEFADLDAEAVEFDERQSTPS
ncbi:MAG: hypothetical protein OEW42_02920 [Acidimicrobiia bacterium]|nr:hypothetical protein [Acidimicrobiia bacterium]